MKDAKETPGNAGGPEPKTSAEWLAWSRAQSAGPSVDDEGNIILDSVVGGGKRILTVRYKDGTVGVRTVDGPMVGKKPDPQATPKEE